MSTPIPTAPRPFQFDPQRLAELAESRRAAYESATPFPHIVMDDFLPEEVLDGIVKEFPDPKQADWFAFDSPTERKLATKDDSVMGPATRHLLAELNSAAFVDFLERLTGIEGLVPDPHFTGGGLHQIERGGHLKVHADFNRHPRTGLERRLNVLLYLNRDWLDEYGGALELWGRDMKSCEARILPLFNRCVVFSTTSTTFHGHPEPLSCPEDRTRKSMALYFYSKDPSPESSGGEHSTLFQPRPGDELSTQKDGARTQPRERLKWAARRLAPPVLLDAARRARARRR